MIYEGLVKSNVYAISLPQIQKPNGSTLPNKADLACHPSVLYHNPSLH